MFSVQSLIICHIDNRTIPSAMDVMDYQQQAYAINRTIESMLEEVKGPGETDKTNAHQRLKTLLVCAK
jgi:hypothetical protein